MAREGLPARTEEPHDAGSEFDMRLPFRAVHVRLAPVAPVVDQEGDPQAGVGREAVQAPPGQKDQCGMQKQIVCSEKEAAGTGFHVVTGVKLYNLAGFFECQRLRPERDPVAIDIQEDASAVFVGLAKAEDPMAREFHAVTVRKSHLVTDLQRRFDPGLRGCIEDFSFMGASPSTEVLCIAVN